MLSDKTRTYLYSFEDKFDVEDCDYFHTTEWVGYHEAAQEICERSDQNAAEYPDEQAVWVLDEKHDTPRRFVVYAEMRRHYSARELVRNDSHCSTRATKT